MGWPLTYQVQMSYIDAVFFEAVNLTSTSFVHRCGVFLKYELKIPQIGGSVITFSEDD